MEKSNDNKLVLAGIEFTEDGRIGNQVVMNLDEPGEFLEIPLYPNKEEKMINDPKLIQATLEELDQVSFEQLDKAIKKADKEESVNPDDVIRARMEDCWFK